MNVNQFINELTQWFDFSMHMVRNHPLVSVITVLVTFVFQYALSAMKLASGIIAMVTAILLEKLVFCRH
jgi:hypothetical protein